MKRIGLFFALFGVSAALCAADNAAVTASPGNDQTPAVVEKQPASPDSPAVRPGKKRFAGKRDGKTMDKERGKQGMRRGMRRGMPGMRRGMQQNMRGNCCCCCCCRHGNRGNSPRFDRGFRRNGMTPGMNRGKNNFPRRRNFRRQKDTANALTPPADATGTATVPEKK